MSTKRKVIAKGVEGRDKLVEGVDYYANCIQPTFGPFGLNWYLEKGDKFTNDGKNIGSELEHWDEIIHRGLVAVRRVTIKTNDILGDGSTGTPLLYRGILKEAIKKLPSGKSVVGKMTPADLRNTVKKETDFVVARLMEKVTPIKSKEELIKSAMVSTENEELSRLIAGMQWELGKDGIIIAEDSNDKKCSIKRVSGVRIDNGLGTARVMNNLEKQMLELEDCRIILTNYTIGRPEILELVKENTGILDTLSKKGTKRLIILARAFTNEAIQDCMANTQGGFGVYPVNAPYTDQSEIMKDLAAVLGGSFIDSEERSLSDIQLSDIGFVKKIQSRRFDAILTGNDDELSKQRVLKRIEELNQQLKGSESEFEKRRLQERISQLDNGLAILTVGALTIEEKDRLLDKAEDAVNAVRWALQEGTVKGAGLAFKEISDELPDTYILKQPLQILYDVIVSSAPSGWTIPEWVRDPVKIMRVSLENASEGAINLATTIGATATERDKPLDMLLRKSE